MPCSTLPSAPIPDDDLASPVRRPEHVARLLGGLDVDRLSHRRAENADGFGGHRIFGLDDEFFVGQRHRNAGPLAVALRRELEHFADQRPGRRVQRLARLVSTSSATADIVLVSVTAPGAARDCGGSRAIGWQARLRRAAAALGRRSRAIWRGQVVLRTGFSGGSQPLDCRRRCTRRCSHRTR
jgi:hypothetical protein